MRGTEIKHLQALLTRDKEIQEQFVLIFEHCYPVPEDQEWEIAKK